MSTGNNIPLVILGGADRRATKLPSAGQGKHPLVGYKAVDIRIGGRPLVEGLIARLRGAGGFDPIYIAGPEKIYRAAGVSAPVIDTDSTFGGNIRASVEHVSAELPGKPLGLITGDILPEEVDIRRVMADYGAGAPYAFWAPLIRAPASERQLGEFSWKPRYRIRPERRQPAWEILPGHLVIADPNKLRKDFMYRLFQIGYSTRNRSIAYRRTVMVLQMLGYLMLQDARQLSHFELPNVTWSVISSGLTAAAKLRAGQITRPQLEKAVSKIFVQTKHRKRLRHRAVSLPLLEGLSFARDIDTLEEAIAYGVDPSALRAAGLSS